MLLLKGCKFQEGFNFLVHTTNTCTACGLTHANKRKIFVIEGKMEQINLVEELKRNYVILNEIIYMYILILLCMSVAALLVSLRSGFTHNHDIFNFCRVVTFRARLFEARLS